MLEKIGKYEVSEQIGVGGFGAVYRGRDPFIKRTVAIKTCQVNDEEIKHRFFREAELAGNLHHRNITTIYDFGVENGIPYIVQEFLTGEDLDKKIKRAEPIPMARKVEILMAIADGLGYAHSASIVHRDVKPANVRILEDGTVKMMDFGIAKSLQTESNLTQTGTTLGTSAYLAPEQIRGEPLDGRTDIFAMGVLAYELLTHRKPFRGEHLSTVLYKILNETPEPIGSLSPDAPPALVAAVNRAMAKTPAERYPTMEAFRRDLQAVYRELLGSSGKYPTAFADTGRTIRTESSEDLETTLATPSSGVAPSNITPPSGALARSRAPSEATPTSAGIGIGARPPLELVNFRDPGADAVAEEAPPGLRRTADTQVGVKKTRLGIFAAILVLIAGAATLLLNRPREVAPKPPSPAPVPAAPTAALEFPVPKLGQGERPAAKPLPAEAPPATAPLPTAAAAAPAPPLEKPVAVATAKKYKVQFSSVPIATVSVDGKPIGPSIPARTLQLDEGDHKVRFAAKGFPAYEKEFHVSGKSENRIHYQFPVTMLVIEAPGWAGARVLVDGKYKGILPDASRLRLSAGSYNVTLSRDGANPVTQKLTLSEGAPKTWNPPPPSPAGPGGT
ncbi:MAG TPA: serine/threonine-protein kinase [Thermoanaerobaculia bacterium]